MKTEKKSKERLLLFYKEYLRWSILLNIKYIRDNKFPNQLPHWIESLKKDLETRKRIFKELDEIKEEKQITIDF